MKTINELTLKAMTLKVYDYKEGKAIFVNNEKVFLPRDISNLFDILDEVDAEWEKVRDAIEIEIEDEIKSFPIIEKFENYDGRDHRHVSVDFMAIKSFIEKYA